MPMRIERLADRLFRLDAMLAQQLMQLLQSHADTGAKRLDRSSVIDRERALQIVHRRKQLADEALLLRPGATLAFLRIPFFKIVEVCGEANEFLLRVGQIFFE